MEREKRYENNISQRNSQFYYVRNYLCNAYAYGL